VSCLTLREMRLWFCVLATEEISTDDRGSINVRQHQDVGVDDNPRRPVRAASTSAATNLVTPPLCVAAATYCDMADAMSSA
jgi:hypothetical protein